MAPAQIMLARECGLVPGPVPDRLVDALDETPYYGISQTEFLLRLPNDLAFHYRKGEGVAISRPAGIADEEVELFFNGSVHGAVAWMNGLVPLHASAIVKDGRVLAFTGPSGAGKSTLAAALCARGFGFFSDDVLMFDPAQGHCLPGHKRLKLWGDALALTQAATKGPRVRPDLDKYFTDPATPPAEHVLPPATLHFLAVEDVDAPRLEPLEGADRFRHARPALYRPRFARALFGDESLFRVSAALAGAFRMARFVRARDAGRFAAGADWLAGQLCGAQEG